MPTIHSHDRNSLPLAGCYVVERARSVAAAYAGRLLATLGATVVMLEPEHGSSLSYGLVGECHADISVAPYRFRDERIEIGFGAPLVGAGEERLLPGSLS